MREVVGKCPHCEYAGNVGEACRERVCSRKGYHFIPINHFEDLKDRPFHARDQHIGLVMGDYLIVGEVGKGGFGKVYLALQLPVLMKAALKLMVRGSSDPVTANTLLKKFEGEALSLARVNHPNIVRLLKYGTFVDTPYIVMEFVENGRTLKQEVTERVFIGDGFEAATAKHIVGQILNALECAHGQKIIHRDIKPENIMLQHVAGDKYFVRILDFGLSKFVEDRTQTSMVVGTPTYMAPEQITGKNIGPWTDLYAVGVIAYEMITGRRPFAGKSRQEIFSRKLDPLYNPIERILDVGYPEAVLRFFERAVAREADDRYSNVHEFRDGVERVFRALEKTAHVSISSSDLAQLLDSNELLQLTVVRERLEEEQKRIAHEKQALEDERKQVAALRERYESGNHTDDNRPESATVALRNSSSDALRRSDARLQSEGTRPDGPPDSLSFRHYGGVGAADLQISNPDLRTSSPISSSLIQRLPKGRSWLSWKVVVPGLTLVAATVLFILNPWSRAKVENNKPMSERRPVQLPGTATQADVLTPRPLANERPAPKPNGTGRPTNVTANLLLSKPLAKTPDATTPSPKKVVARVDPPTPRKPEPPKGGPKSKTSEKQAPPARVQLRIDSEPQGAKILVKGKSIGVTPKVWSISPSTDALEVVLQKKGFQSRKFAIKRDQNGTYSFALKKSAKPPRMKRKRKSDIFGLPQVP